MRRKTHRAVACSRLLLRDGLPSLSLHGRVNACCFEARAQLFRLFTRKLAPDKHSPRLSLSIVSGVCILTGDFLNVFLVLFCFFTSCGAADEHSISAVVSRSGKRRQKTWINTNTRRIKGQ